MKTRELNVLILGEIPEIGNIFSRRIFTEELPAKAVHITEYREFEAAIDQEEVYSLVLLDIMPYGLEILEHVRKYRPACHYAQQ